MSLRQDYALHITRNIAAENLDLVVSAFCDIPRENFLPPPPWTVISSNGRFLSSSLSDIYSDNLVAILENDNINNGQPSLWAWVLCWSCIKINDTILHYGSGLGYYTAIMAKIVGINGAVYFSEINNLLLQQCTKNLFSYNNCKNISCGQSFLYDFFIASFGMRYIKKDIFEKIKLNGFFIFPMTDKIGKGHFIKINKKLNSFIIEIGRPCYFITSFDYSNNDVSNSFNYPNISSGDRIEVEIPKNLNTALDLFELIGK